MCVVLQIVAACLRCHADCCGVYALPCKLLQYVCVALQLVAVCVSCVADCCSVCELPCRLLQYMLQYTLGCRVFRCVRVVLQIVALLQCATNRVCCALQQCNNLRVAHCNMLQCDLCICTLQLLQCATHRWLYRADDNTLQHTCNTLQHTATVAVRNAQIVR